MHSPVQIDCMKKQLERDIYEVSMLLMAILRTKLKKVKTLMPIE